jgi:hypothetical protein
VEEWRSAHSFSGALSYSSRLGRPPRPTVARSSERRQAMRTTSMDIRRWEQERCVRAVIERPVRRP